MISKDDFYNPEEALNHIHDQQATLKAAMDVQVVLQLLIKHEIVTQEEIAEMRLKVAELPTYSSTLQNLHEEEVAMQYAIDHPQEHLKNIFRAKMDGKLK